MNNQLSNSMILKMDTVFKIRTATNNDTEKIIDLVKRTLPEFNLKYNAETSESDLANIEKNYIKSGGAFLVIETDTEEITGTVALQKINNSVCKIRKMYVDKKFRGLKLGDKLMINVLQNAIRLNFEEVYLETVYSMTAAIHLYKKYGFQIKSGVIANSPRCDIIMCKKLMQQF